ncbi:Rv2175c family DNA-binding protein [Isoptericola sp. b441]|uniref:Rv2175c family DNA-binding protein n=1 Tax=Actinotalea lenta TaxID=3064654 RepID=A0ABT9DAP9_9CELL|nr:Rv2175c family DNA-binding protein [Isoptericola sp. b441]MDO8107941.1 Rv2175c family DNA-binding protein [Isoptericola sp. b441]
MDDVRLEDLVGDWLPLPDVAERLGTDVGKVRRMLADGSLIAVRLGERQVLGVPVALLHGDDGVLPYLTGTITVLRDSGFSDEEAVAWLFTPDASLAGLPGGPATPVEALRAGFKTEIRRRAQALAL